MDKYWYGEGMCKALHYRGLYPMTYTSDDGRTFNKKCMCCQMITDGRCQIPNDQCDVFNNSPTEMENHWQLRNKL